MEKMQEKKKNRLNGWNKISLDEIATIHDSKRVPLNSRERGERQGDIPYYGAQGIIDYIDDYIFDGNYVLIAEDGENLRSRKQPIAFRANGKFWVNNHAHIVLGKELWMNDYIEAFFRYTDISPYITGAAQPKLNQENLLNVEIPFDHKKAKEVSKNWKLFQEKIELNNKVNKILEEMAQAIFKQWFVDFKFPGYEKVKMIDSELGKIPDGWEVFSWGKLEDFSLSGDWGSEKPDGDDRLKVHTIRGTDIPALRVGNVDSCPVRYISDSSLEKRNLIPGDIVIEISGGSKGQPTGRSIFVTQTLLDQFGTPVVPTSFCRLIRGNNTLHSILMYLHLNRLYRTRAIKNYQIQSTGISNFQYSQFQEYEKLVIPPKDIQEEIYRMLIRCVEVAHRGENKKLTKTRDTLLPKLMKGEIRV